MEYGSHRNERIEIRITVDFPKDLFFFPLKNLKDMPVFYGNTSLYAQKSDSPAK